MVFNNVSIWWVRAGRGIRDEGSGTGTGKQGPGNRSWGPEIRFIKFVHKTFITFCAFLGVAWGMASEYFGCGRNTTTSTLEWKFCKRQFSHNACADICYLIDFRNHRLWGAMKQTNLRVYAHRGELLSKPGANGFRLCKNCNQIKSKLKPTRIQRNPKQSKSETILLLTKNYFAFDPDLPTPKPQLTFQNSQSY